MRPSPLPSKEALRAQLKRDIRGVEITKVKPGETGLPDDDVSSMWHNAMMASAFGRGVVPRRKPEKD